MTKDLTYYAKKFANLRVDKARGTAPHKPILLLTVLDLFEKGLINRNEIYLSPELTANFLKFWHQFVASDHHSNIALPFFHLTGDKFWHLMPNPGFEATIQAKVKIRTLPALHSAVKYAYLDGELFALLQAPQSRQELTRILIQAWFPGQEGEITKSFKYDAFDEIQQSLFDSGGAIYSIEDLKDEDQMFTRNGAFRRTIVNIYNHQCAFCRVRVVGQNNLNLVDGALIKPFSTFRNNMFVNGLSLCKNHHWAFDKGWFGVDGNYKISIPEGRFTEEKAINSRGMKDLHRESIALPNNADYYPDKESLKWHMEYWKIF